MFLGTFQLGQFVPIGAMCVDGDREPGAPTYAPTVKVYSAGGTRVVSARMPPLDRYVIDGQFCYSLRLGSTFAVGNYMASVSYVLSGNTYVDTHNFRIVAGGDANGAIVAMTEYRTPAGTHLVQRLDSDQRVLGRGPGV